MNVLHILTKGPWTERAEPAVDLCLAQRKAGLNAMLACTHPPKQYRVELSTAYRAREKGLEPTLEFASGKHFRLLSARKDAAALAALADTLDIRVLHAHMENAHLVGGLTARKASRRPLLVFQSYEPEGPLPGFRSAWLMRKMTDGLTVVSERAKQTACDRFKIDEGRVEVIEPGIDLDRFDPSREITESPSQFELPPGHLVAGMVTRVRRDRRVDFPIKALSLVAEECPELHVMIMGHGEGLPKIRALIADRGLEGRVHLVGYGRGDRLVAAYRAMHLLIYPVPGTDRSCRTVREAMASGVAVIATRTGFLPELVEEGVTGCFVEMREEHLADIFRKLYADRPTIAKMGESALETAQRRFSLALQAERTTTFYERLEGMLT